MAVISLYKNTFKGSVIMTGNSLGISTATGTQIGAFAIGLPTNIPPKGTTTTNFALNSASGQLTIPSGSTVKSAFLLWSAESSNSSSSIGNGTQNNAVTLRAPSGAVTNITPAVPFRQLSGTIAVGSFSFYSNAADVTSIVVAEGSGFYTVGNIAGVVGPNGEHNGWILIVAYENQSETFRNINIWTMLQNVAGGSPAPPPVDIPISGFSTPSLGPTPGRLILSAGNGNAELSGESVFLGPNTSSLATLSGPNNRANNFFASQINNNLGALDTTGTFGTANSTPGVQTPVGVRNNWDITRVDASPGLTNNQTSAIIRVATVQDSLWLTGAALQVDVNAVNLNPLSKTVDKIYAQVGDTLTYTIVTKNAGLVPALNTIFMDTLPFGVNYNSGTFKIDGTPSPENPTVQPGASVGTIAVNQTVTLSFDVTVTTVPSTNTLVNQGSIGYVFIPAPGLSTIPANDTTTKITTTLVNPILTKLVDATIASCGDTLKYTSVYTFANLPTTVSNVVFSDTTPANTTFKTGSVTVNNVGDPSLNPTPPGFAVNSGGSIVTSQPLTITHNVTLNNVTSTTTITNQSTSTLQFFNGTSMETVTIASNQVNTLFNPLCASTVKTVDKAFADVGQILTYTITISNNGTTLNNVIFKDTIPNNTAYVTNSFTDNGTSIPGSNPSAGVSLSAVAPGTVRTLTFQVTVLTIPSPNPIPNAATTTFNYTLNNNNDSSGSLNTNIVSTQVNNGDLYSVKSVNKAYANVGDILTYTIVMTNIGNVSTNNIQFVDVIPQGTALVANSFKENGVTITNPNPDVAVPLKSITVGGVTTVTFKVLITTIPPNNPIPNQSRAIYSYFFTPSQTGKSGDSYSNTVFTQVNNANLGNSLKSVDKTFATCGDTINYEIIIPNTGNVTAQNVVFKDTIPNGTTFVTNSVRVNGTTINGANPSLGITIPNLGPGEAATVNFAVQVVC